MKKISLLFLISIWVCFFYPSHAQNDSEKDTFTFVFITDSHLDFEDSNSMYSGSLQYFEKAINTINKLNPEFIVTGGDNTYGATNSSESFADSLYDLYLARIGKFKMPVYTGIGNHDSFGVKNPDISSKNLWYGKKLYEAKIGKRYYSFHHKGWKFFMIDDIVNTETGSRYIGSVDNEQMAWIKDQLAETNPATPIVICTHIPLVYVNSLEEGFRDKHPSLGSIPDFLELSRLFANHNLKLVLQGHTHSFQVLYSKDIYYITGPALQMPKWGNKHHPGFLLIRLINGEVDWEFIDNNL